MENKNCKSYYLFKHICHSNYEFSDGRKEQNIEEYEGKLRGYGIFAHTLEEAKEKFVEEKEIPQANHYTRGTKKGVNYICHHPVEVIEIKEYTLTTVHKP